MVFCLHHCSVLTLRKSSHPIPMNANNQLAVISKATPHNSRLTAQAPLRQLRHGICIAKMLDNVGLRYPHRASGAKAPRTLRPLPLLRFAVSATGGTHLCSIQYYLRFWLGICRTSLAVSALRIMRYCLVLFYPFPCCFSTVATGFTNRKHIPPATALATASICRAGRSSSWLPA